MVLLGSGGQVNKWSCLAGYAYAPQCCYITPPVLRLVLFLSIDMFPVGKN